MASPLVIYVCHCVGGVCRAHMHVLLSKTWMNFVSKFKLCILNINVSDYLIILKAEASLPDFLSEQFLSYMKSTQMAALKNFSKILIWRYFNLINCLELFFNSFYLG